MCMYLLVLCQYLNVSAGIMSVYACMCSYYETWTKNVQVWNVGMCMYLNVSVGIVSVSACICWGYVDACFPRGICDCAGRPGSCSPPALLKKLNFFDHVNWKCVLHRPYPHHRQPGSLTDSQWRPSSVSPGRYSCSYMQIQANSLTYIQIHE